MLTDKDMISLWNKIKARNPGADEQRLVPLFTVQALRDWGWPYKPVSVSKSMPPINQTFLGYYPETGWLLDYWKEGYIPYAEDMPTHWLSMNVLPIPFAE